MGISSTFKYSIICCSSKGGCYVEMAKTSGIVLLAFLLKGDYCGDGMAYRNSTVCFWFKRISQIGVGLTFKYSIVCCSSKGGWWVEIA